jgi:hypothetical protein
MQRAGLLAQKTPHFIKRASTVNNEGFDRSNSSGALLDAIGRKRRAYRCAICGRMPGQGGLFAILCVNAQRPVDLLTKNDRMSEEALRSMGLLFDME